MNIIKLTSELRERFNAHKKTDAQLSEHQTANIARQKDEFKAFYERLKKVMPAQTYKNEDISVFTEKLPGNRDTISVRVPAADYEIRLILKPNANEAHGEIAMESWGFCAERERTTWRPYESYGSLRDAMISFCHNAAVIVPFENQDAVIESMNVKTEAQAQPERHLNAA